MLDTTWRIIRKSVTTVIMAVYRNMGAPLGFAFGAAETVELYEQHFAALNHLFGINLNHYNLESDQGSALRLLCTNKGQVQLFCLRHFLLSLGRKNSVVKLYFAEQALQVERDRLLLALRYLIQNQLERVKVEDRLQKRVQVARRALIHQADVVRGEEGAMHESERGL
jgi:E3 ubiquitin-protein ligase DOA10